MDLYGCATNLDIVYFWSESNRDFRESNGLINQEMVQECIYYICKGNGRVYGNTTVPEIFAYS